jgi:hypothetical protein
MNKKVAKEIKEGLVKIKTHINNLEILSDASKISLNKLRNDLEELKRLNC